MYKLTIQNEDLLQLDFNGLSGDYLITNIQGLSPAKATMNTNEAALIDGALFNSSKVNMRTINIAFTIENRVEYNRLFAYAVLRPKKSVTLHYQSSLLDVTIEGYVESFDVTHFEAKQVATVAIICPSPYWKSAEAVITEMSTINDMFYFPFSSEGGRNLLVYPYFYSTRTINGITFTDNGDGSITVNGTATATASYILTSRAAQPYNNGYFKLDPQRFILSGCPEGGSSSNYWLQAAINNQSASAAVIIAKDYGESATFELSNTELVQIGIVVNSGVTMDNVTFYPMVRYASDSITTWQPFNYGEIVFGEQDNETTAIVLNGGGIEAGLTFELLADGPVTNPKIFNYLTQEFIGIDFSLEEGDLVTITTGVGNKTITLFRHGQTANIFNFLMKNSTWLTLPSAGGVFVYTVDSGLVTNLEVTITHYDLYEGV